MSADKPDPRFGRRWLFGLGAAAALGGATARFGVERARAVRSGGPKVTLTPRCALCTGCVAACPEAAVAVTDSGIAIDSTRCTRCGYCEAVCPVGGVRVERED